jgi:hypothetical protein
MLEPYRSDFNARFTEAKYRALIARMNAEARTEVEFRIAETPCFFDGALLDRMVRAGEELTQQLLGNAEYMAASRAAIPEAFRVPNQDSHPHFMTVDFGLVRSAAGELEPKLVEMQAFPSIFGYQPALARAYMEVFELNSSLKYLFGDLDEDGYWAVLREVIVGEHDPKHVVLLEVEPEKQKTLPDFNMHAEKLGIRIADVAKLHREGKRLFYRDEDADEYVPIERIYNRVIVDELERKGVELPFDYRDELEVEWAGHPNWYFQISKFSIPHLEHPTVPAAVFLDDWFAGKGRDRLPEDRSQWVF